MTKAKKQPRVFEVPAGPAPMNNNIKDARAVLQEAGQLLALGAMVDASPIEIRARVAAVMAQLNLAEQIVQEDAW